MAIFVCSNCGEGTASWLGRCPSCGQWNTFKEMRDSGDGKSSGGREETKKMTVVPMKKIAARRRDRLKTDIYEFDRVLGNGFIPGEVILLTGEPGVGKSTLLLQALQNLNTIYISGEESAEQVKDRAERLKISLDKFAFSDSVQVEGIIAGIGEMEQKPDVLVVDSVQTVYSKEADGAPGSVGQLREAASKLVIFAKQNHLPVIIIGHVTKEGEIAGPKTLEHMVDCVLAFEGEKVSNFRILRATKNRFGTTDEIGIFEMRELGLAEVDNPLVFIDSGAESVPGKAIVGVAEGKRSLFFEIQTLAVPTVLSVPRRVVKGVDYNKVLLLLAVLRKQLYLPFDKFDIYVNVVGGVDVKSTAADLGIAASLVSSVRNTPIPAKTVFIGEVGLLGEIRKVFFGDKVASEAKRLKFAKIVSAASNRTIRDIGRMIGGKTPSSPEEF